MSSFTPYSFLPPHRSGTRVFLGSWFGDRDEVQGRDGCADVFDATRFRVATFTRTTPPFHKMPTTTPTRTSSHRDDTAEEGSIEFWPCAGPPRLGPSPMSITMGVGAQGDGQGKSEALWPILGLNRVPLVNVASPGFRFQVSGFKVWVLGFWVLGSGYEHLGRSEE